MKMLKSWPVKEKPSRVVAIEAAAVIVVTEGFVSKHPSCSQAKLVNNEPGYFEVCSLHMLFHSILLTKCTINGQLTSLTGEDRSRSSTPTTQSASFVEAETT